MHITSSSSYDAIGGGHLKNGKRWRTYHWAIVSKSITIWCSAEQ